jgi:hypothetical protein
VLVVIAGAGVLLASLPSPSPHFHDNPTGSDEDIGAVIVGTALLLAAMFCGWVEWNKRHPPRDQHEQENDDYNPPP